MALNNLPKILCDSTFKSRNAHHSTTLVFVKVFDICLLIPLLLVFIAALSERLFSTRADGEVDFVRDVI